MIILEGITEKELLNKIEAIFEKKLKESIKIRPKQEYRYLSRKEVAKILHITLPTLHEWTKQGLIPSYRIGKRILFKLTDVDRSIIYRNFTSGIR